MRVTPAGVTLEVVGGPTLEVVGGEVFRQPLPGLPSVTLGYSIGLKSVRQPEPGLLRVTPLTLATRLLGNTQ